MKNNVEIMGVQFVKPQDEKWYLCPSKEDVVDSAMGGGFPEFAGWYPYYAVPRLLFFYDGVERYNLKGKWANSDIIPQINLGVWDLATFQWWEAEHQQMLQSKYILQVNLFQIWLGYSKVKDFVVQYATKAVNKLQSFVSTFKGKGTEQ